MLEKISSFWLYGSNYGCIEYTTLDNQEVIFGVTASKKKGEYTSINSFEVDSIKNLSSYFPKNQHCYLTINSDKVLIKESEAFESDLDIIANCFPSISLDDFYYEILRFDTNCYAAVCRKSYADNLIKSLEENAITILGFSLGFFPIKNSLTFLNQNTISTSRGLLEIDGDSITGFKKTSDCDFYDVSIEDIKIKSSHLIALSCLSNYSYIEAKTTKLSIKNSKLFHFHKQKIFFRKSVRIAAVVFIIALLINAFLFNSYFTDLGQLKQQNTIVTAKKDQYSKRLNDLEKKEEIVTNILKSGSSKASFYINRITYNKPISISLNVLTFNPTLKAIRADKIIEYDQNKILVEGISTSKDDFSKWITALESLEWVELVSVNNYGFQAINTSSFSLLINVSDESKK